MYTDDPVYLLKEHFFVDFSCPFQFVEVAYEIFIVPCLFNCFNDFVQLSGIREKIQPENVYACSILCCAFSHNILPN